MTRRRIGRSSLDALAGLLLFDAGTFIGERVNVRRGSVGPMTRGTMDPQHPGRMEARCPTRR
jgi:hypothetical protein